MALPSSLLKQTVELLSTGTKIKKKSLIPRLKKQGVTNDEIKLSGLEDNIKTVPGDTVTSEQARKFVDNRNDRLTNTVLKAKEGSRPPFADITIPGSNLDTYEVNLRRSNFAQSPERAHFTSLGFKDIVWHTRVTTENIGGKSTRFVQEIQSDLFQSIGDVPVQNTPFNKNWLKKALEQEVLTAVENKNQALAVPLNGFANALGRSAKVDAWYSSQVKNTLKKIAKKIGGEYKEEVKKVTQEEAKKELLGNIPGNQVFEDLFEEARDLESARLFRTGSPEDSIDELSFDNTVSKFEDNWEKMIAGADLSLPDKTVGRIILPKGDIAKLDDQIKLYSASVAGVGLTTEDPFNNIVLDSDDPFSEIEQLGLETPTGIPEEGDFPVSTTFEPQEVPEYTPETLRTELGSIARSSLIGGVASEFNEEFRVKNQENQSRLAAIIADGMEQHGMQVEVQPSSGVLGGFTVLQVLPDGSKVELDSDFWREVGNSKYEIGGAIGVAAAAARAGSLLPGWGKVVSVMSGAALGAAVGRGADIVGLANATNTLENLQDDFIRDQMVEAGVLDAALGVIGSTAITAAKGTFKLLGRAYDFVLNGNTEGAFKALKNHVGIDDDQAKEIVNQWETITGGKAPGGSLASKAISVAVRTQPGTEGVLNQAVVLNPKVGGEISKGIADRAKNVLESVKGLTSENVAQVVTDDLGNYVKEVKNFYGAIKTIAVQEMKQTDFRFNYGKLAIDPLIKDINRKVTNPALKEQLLNTLDRARSLSKRALTDRKIRQGTFQNLLDLRTVMNDFKHNRRIVKFDDIKAVDKVLTGIEKEIKRGVTENMADPDRWLKEWKRANTEYSKMLSLKDNIMFKALTKPGIDADKVTAILAKDIKSIDSTFMQVMGRLPSKTRSMVEGAVLKNMVTSRSIGDQAGQQAIDFVKLQKDLAKMDFTSPNVRDTKRAINKLANVFKNDVNLFRASGKVSTDKFQSYLTADPVVRLKFAFASTMFNKVSKLIPSGRGDASALIDKASQVLKNPASSKSVQSLINDLPADPQLASTINQMAIEYAKFGYKEAYPDVRLFRTEGQGKNVSGRLGKGKYWTTNESKAKTRAVETGSKVTTEKFKPIRIADETNLPEGVTINDLNDETIVELKRQGFTGFTEGDDIVIFEDLANDL